MASGYAWSVNDAGTVLCSGRCPNRGAWTSPPQVPAQKYTVDRGLEKPLPIETRLWDFPVSRFLD